MNTTELKKLAEQCICHPISRSTTEVENAGEAIISLLALNAELAEALNDAVVLAEFAECLITDPAIEGMSRFNGKADKYRAALAKYEGGEL